jgi:hypothetical protein
MHNSYINDKSIRKVNVLKFIVLRLYFLAEIVPLGKGICYPVFLNVSLQTEAVANRPTLYMFGN